MKRKWKVILGIAFVILLTGGVFAGVKYNQRGIVTVQTGKVVRQDLASVVTASGEIKPRNYINLGANTIGAARITELRVVEGDRVRRGQIVARLESVQAEADVAAQRAALGSMQADSAASEAAVRSSDEGIQTAQATLARSKVDVERTRTDFERTQKLFSEKLVAQQELDTRRAELNGAQAALVEAQARIDQAKAQRQQYVAQLSSSQRRVSQTQATLRRASDILDKYNVYSPIDGMVTNLPVRVGETVVPGMQNAAASTVMTVADMSIITAEVKVDETDIVNVKLGQNADINIDAMPGRSFRGRVIEIGNTAILRSTGLAASQSAVSSQEAKDFKVVVAMDNPPEEVRPGLSCTARVTTAVRSKVLTVPIQALTLRQKADLEAQPGRKDNGTTPAGTVDPGTEKSRKEEIQGVFIVDGEKALFRKVDTGITGSTDVEVTNGLKEGDQILTGTYKVIRTIRNNAKVKIDNKPPVKAES